MLPVTVLAAGEHDSHSNNWMEFTAGTTTLSGGSYYLSGDVEYSGTESITVSGEVAPEARVAIAQAANDLLTIQNVEASFVAVQVGGGVNISARSLGAVNVQVIMEALGGGGHQTMAAAQLKHITPEAARSRIQTAIDQYREAQKKSGLESESEQKKKDKQ